MKISPTRIGLMVLGAALIGIAVFGLMAASVTTLTDSDQIQAFDRFEAVIDSLGGDPPRLQRDGSGVFISTAEPGEESGTTPGRLGVLVYRARENKLVRSDIPFWFFRLKGPVVRFALQGSGFDMDRLGLNPKDVARQGPGIILDETFADGDRLLVWAE